MNRSNTAIFIFDGVEVLDFAGPFEVFSRTRLVPGVDSRRSDVSAPFNVFTVARSADTVHDAANTTSGDSSRVFANDWNDRTCRIEYA
jgi:putative intracellular protease/amidase